MAKASAILAVLVEVLLLLLTTVLGVVALLVVLLLLVLGYEVPSVGLPWLEGLSAGLEGRDTWAEASLGLGGVHVQLMLRLAREVLVLLGSRVVLPGVEVRHDSGFLGRKRTGGTIAKGCLAGSLWSEIVENATFGW